MIISITNEQPSVEFKYCHSLILITLSESIFEAYYMYLVIIRNAVVFDGSWKFEPWHFSVIVASEVIDTSEIFQ
jgi:hypothetical protein